MKYVREISIFDSDEKCSTIIDKYNDKMLRGNLRYHRENVKRIINDNIILWKYCYCVAYEAWKAVPLRTARMV